MILDFSVTNYKSFTSSSTVSFVKPGMKTNVPSRGKTWSESVTTVAGVFGANAAGKTTILRAFADLSAAILKPGRNLHLPHKLAQQLEDDATQYTVNFLEDDVRYEYEVRAVSWGIEWEALYAYPTGARRTIFERTQTKEQQLPDIKAGSTLKGPTQEARKMTRKSHLYLAVAHKFGHPALSKISNGLRLGRATEIIMHSEDVMMSNLQWITQQIAENPENWEKVGNALAQVADLGIAKVSVEERELSPELLEKIRGLFNDGEEENVEIPEELVAQIRRSLSFTHFAADGTKVDLTLGAQSDGTRAWFALGGKAISALRTGKILVVDELDSSLHPALTALLVDMFKDPEHNSKGAQLLFSSHDVSLLNNSPARLLDFSETWLVEKNEAGASEIFSLDEFDLRRGNNIEKKYLAGAFGAIPDTHIASLKACLG